MSENNISNFIEKVKNLDLINKRCRSCYNIVKNVDVRAEKVRCHVCTTYLSGPPPVLKENSFQDFPRGWKKFKRFVAKDGRVFEYGIEKPELYKKFNPTTSDEIVEYMLEIKKEKQNKQRIKEENLIKQYKQKKKEKKKK